MSVVPGHQYGANRHSSGANLVPSSSNPGGMQLVNPYLTSCKTDPFTLVELAQAVETADDYVTAGATNKLLLIADQIKMLQQQAQKVLEESARDRALHHAACNMKKVPGTIYYLYRITSGPNTGTEHFSLLSPEEWGEGRCPYEFIAGYMLEHDMSWTPLDQIPTRSLALNRMRSAIQSHSRPEAAGARGILALADTDPTT